MADTLPTEKEGMRAMAVQLFERNAKAYQAAVKMMQQYGKAAIVRPTGTGKGYNAFKKSLVRTCTGVFAGTRESVDPG